LPRAPGLGARCALPAREEVPLSKWACGIPAIVSGLSDRDPATVREMTQLGLKPGLSVIVETGTRNASLRVRVGERADSVRLSPTLASGIPVVASGNHHTQNHKALFPVATDHAVNRCKVAPSWRFICAGDRLPSQLPPHAGVHDSVVTPARNAVTIGKHVRITSTGSGIEQVPPHRVLRQDRREHACDNIPHRTASELVPILNRATASKTSADPGQFSVPN
jgi:hypothetical protein